MRPKLLVANRGEIAIRIFRACREMGIPTVAVYSDADKGSLHVAFADEAYRLGPPPARESYLSVERILDAAKRSGATLVHPGYGFLAENAGFASACTDAGITFVGPPPSAIDAMGSKTESRRRMIAAGVPVVPGMARGATRADLHAFGREAGYPILLKASAGGGGKGMRTVAAEGELDSAFDRATSEAQAFFGDPEVYAEKLVDGARHVEVQVVFDGNGRGVAVGERECSIQRRHQKVVEECPSPVVDAALRAKMGEAALAAARAVGYVSCGTVEFLLDRHGRFYFLEMNTRLQVEHPVTEEVWGVDLAREMISIALGERLSFSAGDIAPRGHAIECRVYAEDPDRQFAPSPGRIESLSLPQGPGVRHDVGVESGSVVPIDYDPMLGKLIVHGRDRREAVSRLARALSEYEVIGIHTSLPFFRRLVSDPDFLAASFDTGWLDRRLAAGLGGGDAAPDDHLVALAAAVLARSEEKRFAAPRRGRTSAWRDAARREARR
ncbi:MAG TPA: biotin carboxylase N-terminal domain-containing protein [Thermoanaerobaculia bacterium]|nr:biotin carboxylase N-terminal domain-containing protein [Thermoanaerobaculia bacterium]